MKYNTLKIMPLGGLGEIGRNMTVYEYEGKILIVDAGIMFPQNSMHGIDYIIPDMQYIIERKQDVVGIVLTHGHEDHIGAITHLIREVQIPIYATGLTRGLIEIKLAKRGLLDSVEIYQIEAGERILIGPFQVDFFHVCHSIPDGVGLGIETPAGLVVHTGDYKFDQTPVDNWPTDFGSLAALAERGVTVLLSDSTNAENTGWTPSEREIDEALEKVFRNAKGRIIIASFASLISRMQQVANAAQRHGRRLAFAGASMLENSAMAMDHGYLHVDPKVLIPLHNALSMKDDQVVIMCTGSQGEPTSILGRLALGLNRQFDIKPGDTVVLSSHTIPGNEESVYTTINQLFDLGADVIYEGISSVHVSGHASQEEMKLLINLLKPKFLVPIHGELRHLKAQARLGKMLGIPEDRIKITQNGGVLELSEGELTEGRPEPYSYVFVDGDTVGHVDEEIVRERSSLGLDGVIILHMVLDQDGKLLKTANDGTKNVINGFRRKGFSIQSFGFLNEEEADDVLKGLHQKILDYLSQLEKVPKDIERAVMKLARSYIFDVLKRRPRILVSVQVVKGK
ncbi:MAG: ribonuclease J [Anaerolineae bacterium]|jgi:ribonuclease J|nr:ribonuclease J [Anaerolineae bacterium]